MKVYSFGMVGYEYVPVEVEITLVPGLPKIHFMGLPDTMIKESEMRIKSALKHQGFQLPKGQQVLVNLKPASVRKKSAGLDLAVAFLILLKTEQIQLPDEIQNLKELYIYGGLSLDGFVEAPDDLFVLSLQYYGKMVLSGHPKIPVYLDVFAVESLSQVEKIEILAHEDIEKALIQPVYGEELYFDKESAQLIELIATGEHSCLIAGPSGSGKSTLAEAAYYCLQPLPREKMMQSIRLNQVMGNRIHWRPFVNPHHTIPTMAMIGGGAPIFPGEISRAHGGMLLMDELLEFKNEVKEALREPIEKGVINICRKGISKVLPAEFILLSTTNLCPCGDYVPGKMSHCRFSLTKCQSYSQKLSGPILDRFHILAFSDLWKKAKDVSLTDIKLKVIENKKFINKSRVQKKTNSRLSSEELSKAVENLSELKSLLPELGDSRRRSIALLKLARTFADMDKKTSVAPHHIQKAYKICVQNFERVRRMHS